MAPRSWFGSSAGSAWGRPSEYGAALAVSTGSVARGEAFSDASSAAPSAFEPVLFAGRASSTASAAPASPPASIRPASMPATPTKAPKSTTPKAADSPALARARLPSSRGSDAGSPAKPFSPPTRASSRGSNAGSYAGTPKSASRAGSAAAVESRGRRSQTPSECFREEIAKVSFNAPELNPMKELKLKAAFVGRAGKPARLERTRKKGMQPEKEVTDDAAGKIIIRQLGERGLRQAPDRRHYRSQMELPSDPKPHVPEEGSEVGSLDTDLHNRAFEGMAGKPGFVGHGTRQKMHIHTNINNYRVGQVNMLATVDPEDEASVAEQVELVPGAAGATTSALNKRGFDGVLYGHRDPNAGKETLREDKQRYLEHKCKSVKTATWRDDHENGGSLSGPEVECEAHKKHSKTQPQSQFGKVVYGRMSPHMEKTMSIQDFNDIYCGAAGMTSYRLAKSLAIASGVFLHEADHPAHHKDGLFHGSELGDEMSETITMSYDSQGEYAYSVRSRSSGPSYAESRRDSRASGKSGSVTPRASRASTLTPREKRTSRSATPRGSQESRASGSVTPRRSRGSGSVSPRHYVCSIAELGDEESAVDRRSLSMTPRSARS